VIYPHPKGWSITTWSRKEAVISSTERYYHERIKIPHMPFGMTMVIAKQKSPGPKNPGSFNISGQQN
jgi:hypothetical protein